jgi:hypothetical protein
VKAPSKGWLRIRRSAPYLTWKQAEVLAAIASHWLIWKRSPHLRELASFLSSKVQTLASCVSSLARRGFLHAEWRRNVTGRTSLVYATLRPTDMAWAELGERVA